MRVFRQREFRRLGICPRRYFKLIQHAFGERSRKLEDDAGVGTASAILRRAVKPVAAERKSRKRIAAIVGTAETVKQALAIRRAGRREAEHGARFCAPPYCVVPYKVPASSATSPPNGLSFGIPANAYTTLK